MMPVCSWPTPGRNPGTSTKVITGTLKASQVRTNRAAFSLASMSRQPANCIGWLATMPTGWPSTRPKPVRMFGANSGCVSKNSASSRMCSITVCMPAPGSRAETGGGTTVVAFRTGQDLDALLPSLRRLVEGGPKQ